MGSIVWAAAASKETKGYIIFFGWEEEHSEGSQDLSCLSSSRPKSLYIFTFIIFVARYERREIFRKFAR